MHTAKWDDGYDLSGKRIAVIGTGASAVQLVPAIADKVAHLDLHQRTPGWVIPRMDYAFEEKSKTRFARLPFLQRLFRSFIYWRAEMLAYGFTRNLKMIAKFQKLAEAELAKAVPDPALRAKLTPDFPVGCKRVLISNDFYPAVQRGNVELVTDAIAEIRPDGIVTADGKLREVEIILYATGFRVTDWLSHVDIRGRGGRKLIDDWKDGASAYYGIAVNGYPNMFLLLGPNTGLGHNSVVFMIESQVRYALDCLKWLWAGAGTVEVKDKVQDAFNKDLHEKMKRTVWMTGCKSWYLNANGTNSTLWPDFTVTYWWKTRGARKRDFDLAPVRVPEKAA
jgi:cation diffusion facilitator CzcD-associated flavoprotein CzcO